MKLRLHCLLAALAFSTIGSLSTAKATTIGLPDPSVGTLWDTFSDVTFSNASGAGANPYMTATLASNNGSGALTGSGDRLYSGAGPATASVDLTISGTATVSLDSLTVYLKYTPASGSGQVLDYFTVTLDGSPTAQVSLGGTGEVVTGQEMNVVSLNWTGLSLAANDAFNISITRPAAGIGQPGHVSIDAVQVVPEPTVAALALLGAGLLASRRRRNSRS